MKQGKIGRRDFIRLAGLTSLLFLSGCSNSVHTPTISVPKGLFSRDLLKTLPSPWKIHFFDAQLSNDLYKSQLGNDADLLLLGDGWLQDCPFEEFQPIDSENAYERLSSQAISFLNTYPEELSSLIFPLAVSPWVLIFRGHHDLVNRVNDTWDVLLEPELKDQIVLPSSARVIISIANCMKHVDSLRLLRSQTQIYDDRNALNWLLSGKASVAMLPMQYCVKKLISDPRLSIVIPKQGSPLNWTCLMRPKSSFQPFPFEWIQETYNLPLAVNFLSRGVIPPLPYPELRKAISYLPDKIQSLYMMNESFQNCWSLPPLNSDEISLLEDLWLTSSP